MLWVSEVKGDARGIQGDLGGVQVSQGVEWGVRVVPGVKGSPRDPRRLRGTSGVHQGVHGAPGISQGVKGDFRGVRGQINLICCKYTQNRNKNTYIRIMFLKKVDFAKEGGL